MLQCLGRLVSCSAVLLATLLHYRIGLTQRRPPSPMQDPALRLGSTAGAAEVMRHAWFASTDFELIYKETAPYVPSKPIFSPLGATGESLVRV